VPPLWTKVLEAVRQTLIFAAAGVSLGLALGLPLACLGTTAGWTGGASGRARVARSMLYASVRLLISGMRSVHELVWAVLFLAAFGLSPFAAVLAIAIPYAGTFAKVFSEMLEEVPRDSAESLRSIGAPPSAIFLFGLAPRALPDACAYAFYRFECGVRSSAVLGFFGFPTLGYYVERSVTNLHFRELWSYLYALLALVVLLELWSGALRRRLVMR
jgi:phosphonate transport system permease protein